MQLPMMDFRGNKFVNEDGTLTDVAQSFFDLLINTLIKNVGPEGIVTPIQSSSTISIIEGNKIVNVQTGSNFYTCQYGTYLYNVTTNKAMVSLNDGTDKPKFYNITVS